MIDSVIRQTRFHSPYQTQYLLVFLEITKNDNCDLCQCDEKPSFEVTLFEFMSIFMLFSYILYETVDGWEWSSAADMYLGESKSVPSWLMSFAGLKVVGSRARASFIQIRMTCAGVTEMVWRGCSIRWHLGQQDGRHRECVFVWYWL